MTYVHIHAPKGENFAQVNHCPTCDRPRRMLGRFVEWYGTRWTCSGCGDSWNDGEREERPFAPGWRKEGIRHAIEGLAKLGIQA
jgi:transposase-like protein